MSSAPRPTPADAVSVRSRSHGCADWVLGGGLNGGRIAAQVRLGETSLFQDCDHPY
ncbi:hypothetical protein ACRAWG_11650 [Methylobacterium sp. P31]